VCEPPPITACGVDDNIQNLVCNLAREEPAGHEQQLKTIANGDIYICTGWTPVLSNILNFLE